ncbi:MAG TPA: hypothetical protein VNJ08_05845 [Bacteriovoracaceae bacterium]|nr:hypothetical protein [Bacteriovoracaceae bacterium]
MKLLSKKISGISKLVLLCSSLFIGGSNAAELVSSDRFLLKIIDQTISLQDFNFQARNLAALNCVYEDAFVVQYFSKGLIKEWSDFLKKFPSGDLEASKYMHEHEPLLKKLRHFYKVLRYADDQKLAITPEVTKLIRASTKENKCDADVLYKDTLKTNFLSLIRMELYFRSRYGGQIKQGNRSFETVRPSIDLFIESLDKQFAHEYYW